MKRSFPVWVRKTMFFRVRYFIILYPVPIEEKKHCFWKLNQCYFTWVVDEQKIQIYGHCNFINAYLLLHLLPVRHDFFFFFLEINHVIPSSLPFLFRESCRNVLQGFNLLSQIPLVIDKYYILRYCLKFLMHFSMLCFVCMKYSQSYSTIPLLQITLCFVTYPPV